MRPVIGLAAYREPTEWADWSADAAVLPRSYRSALEGSGASTVLIPPLDGAADPVVALLDGLVLTGGGDIAPRCYGFPSSPATADVRPDRDRAELALLDIALAAGVPVLGICRGCQLINVAFGGSLIQHVPERFHGVDHKLIPGEFVDHEVSTSQGTRLRAMLGPRAAVRSHHHQAVDQLGTGLVASARADDGLIEAIEVPGERFTVGVQWHPEEGHGRELFAALVGEASR